MEQQQVDGLDTVSDCLEEGLSLNPYVVKWCEIAARSEPLHEAAIADVLQRLVDSGGYEQWTLADLHEITSKLQGFSTVVVTGLNSNYGKYVEETTRFCADYPELADLFDPHYARMTPPAGVPAASIAVAVHRFPPHSGPVGHAPAWVAATPVPGHPHLYVFAGGDDHQMKNSRTAFMSAMITTIPGTSFETMDTTAPIKLVI